MKEKIVPVNLKDVTTLTAEYDEMRLRETNVLVSDMNSFIRRSLAGILQNEVLYNVPVSHSQYEILKNEFEGTGFKFTYSPSFSHLYISKE